MSSIIEYINACMTNDVERVRHLLNICAISGYRALHVACSIRDTNFDIIKCVMENSISKIDIHANNDSIFVALCEAGKTDVIEYMLNYCDSHNDIVNIHLNDDKLMVYACLYSNLDLVKYLIEYSEKHNDKFNISKFINYNCFDYSGLYRYNDIVKYFIYLTKHMYWNNNNFVDLIIMCVDRLIDMSYNFLSIKNINTDNDNDYYCVCNNIIYERPIHINVHNINYILFY